ncbi:MAG: protein O-mannosyl-transferase family, partial [Anaerolineales bacterium]
RQCVELAERHDGLFAAAALGVSTTFWSQSTTANIRSLTGLFAALTLWAFVEWARDRSNRRALTRFALVLALGVVHHGSLAFIGLVWVIALAWTDRSLLRQPRRWVRPTLAALAPLIVLAYLPVRGAAGAFLAPDHLATWRGFWEHVLARGFEGDFFYFATLDALPDRLAILGNIAAFQFGRPLLALGGVAFAGLALRNRRLGAVLAAAVAVHALVSITYRAPQTVEYLLPAYVIAAVGAGAGLALLGEFARRKSQATIRTAYGVLVAATAVAVLSLALRNFRAYAALARDTSTRDFAAGMLAAAPPDAVVLANWHWATPMWYLQQMEGLRTDVEVVYVFPQGVSLADTWVARLHEFAPQQPTLVTSFYATEFGASGYGFAPAGPGWLVTSDAPTTLAVGLTPANLRFGDHWQLRGFRHDTIKAAPGDSFDVEVAWSTNGAPEDANFFVQLLGPDGLLYGQDETRRVYSGYKRDDVLHDRYRLTVAATAPPGEYQIIAGGYRPDGARFATPDGADYAVLGALRVTPAPNPPPTSHRVRFLGGALYGYDFDASPPGEYRLFLHWRLGAQPQEYTLWLRGSPMQVISLPAGDGYLTTTVDLPGAPSRRLDGVTSTSGDMRVVRGTGAPALLSPRLADPTATDRYAPFGGALVLVGAEQAQEPDGSVRVDLTWRAARPLTADDIVKVDLIGPDYAWRAQSDHVPAGGAIPTLKWIPGPAIRDRHRLDPPAGATATGARLELAVYDHFTGRVLSIGDPRLAQLGSTVLLFP